MMSIIIKDTAASMVPLKEDEVCNEESECEAGLKCPTKRATDPAKQEFVDALDKKCVQEDKCDVVDWVPDDNEFTYKC